ncbi:DUF6907 domain-containing protein [Streptomyces sp. AM8-1-1]|uniref:DUF6907 domain-containing protein n=1 Tax=Streptomyces sp. AM8-1-1 TaxID=3075825 RepID=UPI0028C4FFEA|nr:hypothetical protein [Streptomyces sp. AM8-1-1]WNO70133.1 hypothetical protein RPQ07_00090 [Streptomyces sp. AM8-1-1]WNO76982.1 hypothetical protein RPQ07_37635 [Streptomyces sp. AM8-1-1]
MIVDTATAQPALPPFTCPAWCDWKHQADAGVASLEDVVHMVMGPGLAVPRHSRAGWLEVMLTLTSGTCPDGAPGAPHIEVEATGEAGRLSSQDDVVGLIQELRAMTATLETWMERLPG